MLLKPLVAESSQWICLQRQANDNPVWSESSSYESKLNKCAASGVSSLYHCSMVCSVWIVKLAGRKSTYQLVSIMLGVEHGLKFL